jgi:hypothetical protein
MFLVLKSVSATEENTELMDCVSLEEHGSTTVETTPLPRLTLFLLKLKNTYNQRCGQIYWRTRRLTR